MTRVKDQQPPPVDLTPTANHPKVTQETEEEEISRIGLEGLMEKASHEFYIGNGEENGNDSNDYTPARRIQPDSIETPQVYPVDTTLETSDKVQGPAVRIENFEEIYTRFRVPIGNYIYRLVKHSQQAEDLTQDVFVKVFRALAKGTEVEAATLSAWLYRIATNTAIDASRRRKYFTELPLSRFNEDWGIGAGMSGKSGTEESGDVQGYHDATPMTGYNGGRFEQHIADREVMQTVLKRMREKYRTPLLLYEYDGFSCDEIKVMLDLSKSAVKARLLRAREQFIVLYKQENRKSEIEVA